MALRLGVLTAMCRVLIDLRLQANIICVLSTLTASFGPSESRCGRKLTARATSSTTSCSIGALLVRECSACGSESTRRPDSDSEPTWYSHSSVAAAFRTLKDLQGNPAYHQLLASEVLPTMVSIVCWLAAPPRKDNDEEFAKDISLSGPPARSDSESAT